jgi:hypothetical protein
MINPLGIDNSPSDLADPHQSPDHDTGTNADFAPNERLDFDENGNEGEDEPNFDSSPHVEDRENHNAHLDLFPEFDTELAPDPESQICNGPSNGHMNDHTGAFGDEPARDLMDDQTDDLSDDQTGNQNGSVSASGPESIETGDVAATPDEVAKSPAPSHTDHQPAATAEISDRDSPQLALNDTAATPTTPLREPSMDGQAGVLALAARVTQIPPELQTQMRTVLDDLRQFHGQLERSCDPE